MTHVKAREWIKRLPERAGDELDAGCKEVLQEMWDCIRWEIEHSVTGRAREPGLSCWASAETLAEGIGSTERAVSDRQGKLSKAGWIRRDGRGWAMSWAVPFTPECRAQARTRKHRSATDAAPECLADSTAVPDGQHRGVTKRSKEPSNDPSNERDQQGHPCTLSDSPEVTHARQPIAVGSSANSTSQPKPAADSPDSEPSRSAGPSPSANPRKRKPPRPKQGDLGLPESEPVDPLEIAHAELLAEHERLRAAAYAHHRERLPAWPAPFTENGRAIRAGLRQALRDHGADACRAALERRAAEWRGDATKLRYSLASMWSADSLAYSMKPSTANGKRAGPSRGLAVEPNAPDRTYHYQDDSP